MSLHSPDFVTQVQNVTAAHIMKCDDDTFIRVDTILKELYGVSSRKSLYMGNLNLLHRPLRTGKWAVTYEVYEFPLCENVKSKLANNRLYLFQMLKFSFSWLGKILFCKSKNGFLMKQEWPQLVYPPYANGPGYIISNDIAKYIVSQHVNRNLRVCKPES